jgi:hypothetical protein
MACQEFDNAFAWAKQNLPVTAFVTLHGGFITDPNLNQFTGDACRYAHGPVGLNTAGHLAGELPFTTNASSEVMHTPPGLTVAIEIFENGTVSYQQKLNGKPVGGMPPTQFTATACVASGALLTGVHTNEVIVVGVRRDPAGPK